MLSNIYLIEIFQTPLKLCGKLPMLGVTIVFDLGRYSPTQWKGSILKFDFKLFHKFTLMHDLKKII